MCSINQTKVGRHSTSSPLPLPPPPPFHGHVDKTLGNDGRPISLSSSPLPSVASLAVISFFMCRLLVVLAIAQASFCWSHFAGVISLESLRWSHFHWRRFCCHRFCCHQFFCRCLLESFRCHPIRWRRACCHYFAGVVFAGVVLMASS